MKSDRLVIGGVVFVAAGLGLLFGFTNGSANVNLGYPLSQTKLHLDITTTGIPALVGMPLVGAGGLLLIMAFIAAIVSQVRDPEHHSDLGSKRREPFEEFEEFDESDE